MPTETTSTPTTTLTPTRTETGWTETRVSVALDPRGGRVRVDCRSSGGPERPRIRPVVVRSDEAGAVVSLVPEGALLLADDDVRLSVHVGAHARLELIEPAGTVAYDMRGGSARWSVRIVVEEGARLVWHGEPFVVSAGARVTRDVAAVVHGGAVLALREVLVLGRHGEPGGALSQTTTVSDGHGDPVLAEGLDLVAGAPSLLVGGHRAVGSLTLVGAEPSHDVSEGRLDLEAGGTVVRRLADAAHEAVREDDWDAFVAAT